MTHWTLSVSHIPSLPHFLNRDTRSVTFGLLLFTKQGSNMSWNVLLRQQICCPSFPLGEGLKQSSSIHIKSSSSLTRPHCNLHPVFMHSWFLIFLLFFLLKGVVQVRGICQPLQAALYALFEGLFAVRAAGFRPLKGWIPSFDIPWLMGCKEAFTTWIHSVKRSQKRT